MLKIIVIGSLGAGKSTFAQKLRDATDIPLYYLDMLWHKPDQTNILREEFDVRLSEIIKKDKWIIDGNYQRTLEVCLNACDTVFLMEQEKIPPYYIFNDVTLEQLVNKKPVLREELIKIYGFGEKKMEKYGEDIIAIIKKFRV